MNPLRRYAVVLTIAALTSFTTVANTALTESQLRKHAQQSIASLQQQNAISDLWSTISPKYVQKASSATHQNLWVIRYVDPKARKFSEQNLYLILSDSGELIEFTYRLPATYLLVQP